MTFAQGMYSVREDEEVLTVSVERSGDSDSHIMVLIATHPSEGTATGTLQNNLKSCCGHLSCMFINIISVIGKFLLL